MNIRIEISIRIRVTLSDIFFLLVVVLQLL